MPFRGTPVCLKCETNESPMWTNAENLGALCLNCVNETKQNIKQELEEEEDDGKQNKRKPRTTRSYKTRLNPFALPKLAAPKGRGRRGLSKKIPVKAPAAVATVVTSEFVFYKGSYIQIGDIVSMRDEEGDTYYAQITGLMTDQYCEKSAVITWLLPTRDSPPPNEEFDPATYIIGLEEDIPRNLDCMEFIMHAPSDYYKSKTTPYPTIHAPARPGFIWTSMETMQRICSIRETVEEDSDKNQVDESEEAEEIRNQDQTTTENSEDTIQDSSDDAIQSISDEAVQTTSQETIQYKSDEGVQFLSNGAVQSTFDETEQTISDETEQTISEEVVPSISAIEEIIGSSIDEKTIEFPKEEEKSQVEQVEESCSEVQEDSEETPKIVDLSPFIMTED